VGRATYSLADVLRALDNCAPGYSSRYTTHSLLIRRGEKTCALPKGQGGGSEPRRVSVPDHKVKNLVTLFELDTECVKVHLPGILD
jgi:hypothetical protein